MLFVAIIFIVFGILQIVLFFKVWGMTSDVKLMAMDSKEMKIMLKDYLKIKKESNGANISDEDIFVSKRKGQWGKNVSISEKYEAVNLIQQLKENQLVVKFEKNGKFVIAERDKLEELSDYKIVFD